MPRRQRDQLLAPTVEVRVSTDEQPSNSLPHQACEGRFELTFAARGRDVDLPSDAASRDVHVGRLRLNGRIGRIEQLADDSRVGQQLVQKLQAFPLHERSEQNEAGRIAARPVDAGDQTRFDRVDGTREDDRDGGRGSFCGLRRNSARARGDYDGYATTHEFDSETR
jgi:hypothetical protein